MHSCDNTLCVNKDHLLLGSTQENIADKVRKGRHPHGESHGKATLSEGQVREILASKVVSRVLAEHYGVGARHIRYIRARKQWSSVQ